MPVPAVNAFKSSETHGGLNEKQMCRWDGWFEEGGELPEVHCTGIWTGKVRVGEVGGSGEDGRSGMKTAAARVATGRHHHKTDASGNPI